MNGNFKNEDEIGIDPTTVPIIDSLDIDPATGQSNAKGKKPKSKAKQLLTKVLFAFGVLFLMGIVAFGIYYYLNLGKQKSITNPISLENRIYFAGDTLSNSVFDYGNFTKVDVSNCTLDLSGVDNTKAGEYEYYMTCGQNKYKAKITIMEKYDFIYQSNIVYRPVGGTIITGDFIKSSEEYEYNFVNETDLIDKTFNVGGPYLVDINIKDEKKEKEGPAYALMYITTKEVRDILKCQSPAQTNNGNYEYVIIDTFAFDSSRNNLNSPLRIYEFNKLTEQEYIFLIKDIKKGMITIGDITGYAIRDDQNHVLKIVQDNKSKLQEEAGGSFPTSYLDIMNYYSKKEYTCSNN